MREFLLAIGLMLVIEGILPFLYPARWRDMVRQVAEVDDTTLRRVGFIAMLLGAGLVALVSAS